MWVIYANQGGTRHVFYLLPQAQITALKINWISQTFCVLALAFGKISVGFLIMRIGIPQKRLRILLYFFMISQFMFFSLAFIFVYVQCRPITKLWNFLDTQGECWNPQVLTVWTIICSSGLFHHRYLDTYIDVECRLQCFPRYRSSRDSRLRNMESTATAAQEGQPQLSTERWNIVSFSPSNQTPTSSSS